MSFLGHFLSPFGKQPLIRLYLETTRFPTPIIRSIDLSAFSQVIFWKKDESHTGNPPASERPDLQRQYRLSPPSSLPPWVRLPLTLKVSRTSLAPSVVFPNNHSFILALLKWSRSRLVSITVRRPHCTSVCQEWPSFLQGCHQRNS